MLSAVGTLSVALGTLAQGIFVLNDEDPVGGLLALDAPGNWYSGTFGMEVWEFNGTSIPAGVNLSAAPGSGDITYKAIQAAGFVKEARYTNQHTVCPGSFRLGPVWMPDAHAGGTVVVALAAWNSSAPSWSAMRTSANQASRAGVVVFAQPTVPRGLNPAVPSDLAMDQDLVMTGIPEPSALALIQRSLGGR